MVKEGASKIGLWDLFPALMASMLIVEFWNFSELKFKILGIFIC